jgi:hypothetical protein
MGQRLVSKEVAKKSQVALHVVKKVMRAKGAKGDHGDTWRCPHQMSAHLGFLVS